MWIFRPSKFHRKKYVEITWIFRPAKLHRKKYVETTWIFRPAKFHWKKYMETTWIFRPAKLHRKKYVETTWIFRPSKLHRKSTRKWRGNSSKFGLWRVDVIFTSNRRGFDVVYPLDCPLDRNCLGKELIYKCNLKENTTSDGVNYNGLTENTFKDRFYKHRNSLKYESQANSAELSKYFWEMKRKGTEKLIMH